MPRVPIEKGTHSPLDHIETSEPRQRVGETSTKHTGAVPKFDPERDEWGHQLEED